MSYLLIAQAQLGVGCFKTQENEPYATKENTYHGIGSVIDNLSPKKRYKRSNSFIRYLNRIDSILTQTDRSAQSIADNLSKIDNRKLFCEVSLKLENIAGYEDIYSTRKVSKSIVLHEAGEFVKYLRTNSLRLC